MQTRKYNVWVQNPDTGGDGYDQDVELPVDLPEADIKARLTEVAHGLMEEMLSFGWDELTGEE